MCPFMKSYLKLTDESVTNSSFYVCLDTVVISEMKSGAAAGRLWDSEWDNQVWPAAADTRSRRRKGKAIFTY